MSTHIAAEKGEIARTILLPGDPMRAKFIADNFLEDPVCYNQVRGMYGFTGTYQGREISVQGTGMGMPSISIYVNELIRDFDVKNLIRVGSCGSFSEKVKIRDIILAIGACTNSRNNQLRFNGQDYAPTANFTLLNKADNIANEKGIEVKVGNVLSSDLFYGDDPDAWQVWSRYGVLAVEMETAELYTLAAKYGVRALSILTVSDSVVTGEATTAEEREKTFTDMIEIALETAE
ncbi:purine-nucleoside phosphorylase [Halocella sp. SP3-1]|uniref:purine-nucleoside phosphorylase n=1 Tax=Halocella sp. SP3-1 TaxID=2382161 RepID=UPI000F755C0F|nr:purine-nucleoside phosphorylase [Halocella sp. SP3-1]AZO94334.1 purine-nucleoside phosphorylase [Halocella sp. SP3-1]